MASFDSDADDSAFDDFDVDAVIQSQSLKRKRSSTPEPAAVLRDRNSADFLDDFDVDAFIESSPKRPRTQPPSAPGSRMAIARAVLEKSFGYPGFRFEQEAAIARILEGSNVLVNFPTGAGKSLCFQIPAMAFEEIDRGEGGRGARKHPGVTLIVSPLLALMKDQVDALQARGIAADCLDSTKTWQQTQTINASLRSGRLKMLYVAPERLNNERFVEAMKEVAGGIRLLAVDEAHCISEWGDSFRPDYLKVARFAEETRAETVVCLTATATPTVMRDICREFRIDEDGGVFRTTPYRPNLKLLAEAAVDSASKLPRVAAFIREHPGSTIIYVTLQKEAEDVAAKLRGDHGLDTAFFHAGMKTELKQQTQEAFMASEVQVVVATIAFGMGIDKADIRNIVHLDIPMTVEEYTQQIGRAGRDGKPSTCMLYICNDDFYIRENFARGDVPWKASLRGLLADIFSARNVALPVGESFLVNLVEQGNEFDMRRSPLAIIYARLELRFGLIREVTPEYAEYKFEEEMGHWSVCRSDSSPEARALVKAAKKKSRYFYVDVNQVAAETGLLRSDLVRMLTRWNDLGFINLRASGVRNKYRILKPLPTTAAEIDSICDMLYQDMLRRENDAIERTRQISDLIRGDRCFAAALAGHFGMGLPGGRASCGSCTHCLTGRPITLAPREVRLATAETVQDVLWATDVRDDPRFLARVGFGIKSPRITRLKLQYKDVYMSLANYDFESLMRQFELACASAQGVEAEVKTEPLPRSQASTSQPSRGQRARYVPRGRRR